MKFILFNYINYYFFNFLFKRLYFLINMKITIKSISYDLEGVLFTED